MENKESEIPWMDDDVLSSSTRSPEAFEQGGQLTLAIFLIAAVATISLLFAIGVFMDCRHQKIDDEEAQRRALWKLKFKMPKSNKTTLKREDEDCIVENMEENEPTTSSGIV